MSLLFQNVLGVSLATAAFTNVLFTVEAYVVQAMEAAHHASLVGKEISVMRVITVSQVA
mgnify:CR=1 FL=1